jgi:hypothetical protein
MAEGEHDFSAADKTDDLGRSKSAAPIHRVLNGRATV